MYSIDAINMSDTVTLKFYTMACSHAACLNVISERSICSVGSIYLVHDVLFYTFYPKGGDEYDEERSYGARKCLIKLNYNTANRFYSI